MTAHTRTHTAEQLPGDVCAIHNMEGDWFAVTGVTIAEGDVHDTVRIPAELLYRAAWMLMEFGAMALDDGIREGE
jgi:hypothetical protein